MTDVKIPRYSPPPVTLGPHDISCFITEPSGRIHHFPLHKQALGQDCLKKICELLGLQELDSACLGLQIVEVNRLERHWLHMRHQVRHQIPGGTPYYMHLTVKFFLTPDLVRRNLRPDGEDGDTTFDENEMSLQCSPTGAHILYHHVVRHLQEDLWHSDMQPELCGQLLAMMSYVAFGEYHEQTSPAKYPCCWPSDSPDGKADVGVLSAEILHEAVLHHRHLTESAQSVHTTQQHFVTKVAQSFDFYGTFFYEAKDLTGECCLLGIGPQGFLECLATKARRHRKVVRKYPYSQINETQITEKVVHLQVNSGEVSYRFPSIRVAAAMHRYLVEARCFYHEFTVPEELKKQEEHTRHYQKSRSLTSFLHPRHGNLNHRPHYAFDVGLTLREVLRQQRSFCCCGSPTRQDSGCCYWEKDESPERRTSAITNVTDRSDSLVPQETLLSQLRNELHSRLFSTLCCACHSRQIMSVFIPCGHALCCDQCAVHFSTCPVKTCQQEVTERRLFYQTWPKETLSALRKWSICSESPDLVSCHSETAAAAAAAAADNVAS